MEEKKEGKNMEEELNAAMGQLGNRIRHLEEGARRKEEGRKKVVRVSRAICNHICRSGGWMTAPANRKNHQAESTDSLGDIHQMDN